MRPVGYALVGAGAFGRYCLEQFASLDAVELVAVADADERLAASAADDHGLPACGVDALLSRDDVELIHLATPPWTHHELAMRAIEAGKHVLCEKPLATTLADGRAMVEAAARRGVNLAANLIMRHVPHCERVKAVLDSKLLGEPIHAEFVNDAKDEPLPPGHWFWDSRKSGGIFIEHGVHFFDVFAWWLSEAAGQHPSPQATLLSAHAVRRPGRDPLTEQVQAVVRYGEATLATFYHGFTQAARMDRQHWRIVCERGDIRMHEWVPDTLVVDALLKRPDFERLGEIMGGAGVTRLNTDDHPSRHVTARHKSFDVDGRYHLRALDPRRKDTLYGHALRELLTDQARGVRDPNHPRRITEANALNSLELAAAATRMAEQKG